MQAILPFLAIQVPSHIAAWAIAKKNPKLAAFIHASQAAGHSADSIMSYLRNKLKPEGAIAHENELAQRSAQGTARPDEMAALQQVKSAQLPGELLQKGASAGLGAIAGMGASRLAGGEEGMQPESQQTGTEEPAQQQAQPSLPNLQAVKQAGQQLKTMNVAQKAFQQPQQPEAQPGVMEGISEKLKEFVEGRLAKGTPLAKIASLAKAHFFDEIKSIEDESGTSFSQFLESLYGKGREQARVKGLAQQGGGQEKNAFLQDLKKLREMVGK